MSSMRTRRTWLFLVCSLAMVATARADLLTDGGLEYSVIVPDWDLEESIYDQTTMMDRDVGGINSAQQHTFGPHSGTYALWLRAFVGGSMAGPDNLTNAVLSQTVPATGGEEYTFSGWSRFEQSYSGGFDTLPGSSPLGSVTSPTTTTMKLEFLDSGGSVLGSAVSVDVKAERKVLSGFDFANDNVWRQHSLMDTAPTGAASVRVTAEARKMLYTEGSFESAFYDDFALRTVSAPETELLANPVLEIKPDLFDPAWVVTQVPGGRIPTDPTINIADFASRPEGPGQLGVWLRSFTGNTGQPADAILEQTVPGVAQAEYTFSGWSNFQMNYTGGLAGFPTQTLFEMEFLDENDEVIPDSTVTLDLKADGQTNDAGWRQHSLMATSPEGTDKVRVRAAGLDMVFNEAGGNQSAFLDDLMLTVVAPGLLGDFNEDNKVDAADYVVWRKNDTANTALPNDNGVANQSARFDLWRSNFGEIFGSGAQGVAPVPEPSGCWLALMAVLAAASARRN
ncbi:MAG TPA: hypothetical protein VGK58_16205 [Lacipirellulaceae bacterium]